ncbi:MAG: hypothetical protein Q7S77_02280 [Candidatus Staskawiczbacteria bacterium]|nr:hypothetical protein [Candidatus Staskawiczbacteria bacterium]
MDDKFKKDLAEIIGQEFDKRFEKNFQKAFDQSFPKDFDQSFEKALDQLFEVKFIKLFNQGVDDVLIPQFEDIDKEFVHINDKITQGFDNINNRLDNLAIKIDVTTNKQLDDEYQIKKHAEKIAKLESHRVVA